MEDSESWNFLRAPSCSLLRSRRVWLPRRPPSIFDVGGGDLVQYPDEDAIVRAASQLEASKPPPHTIP